MLGLGLVASAGPTELKHGIQATLSILRETIESVDPEPYALRRIVHPGAGSNPIKTAFYAVFMAFYELCVRQKQSPKSPEAIAKALQSLHSRLNVSRGQIRSDNRQRNIDQTIGLIQGQFEDKEPPAVHHGSGSALRFENALRRSRIETASWECKQGLVRLNETRQRDPALLPRLVETLAAIANNADSDGAIFIGVADSETDRKRIEELDGVEARIVGARFCVGVDRELPHLSLDLEGYKRIVVDHISNSKLSSPLKEDVLSAIDCITYRGLSVLCIWVPGQSKPSTVNDGIYYREGSSTLLAEGYTKMQAVLDRFQAKS